MSPLFYFFVWLGMSLMFLAAPSIGRRMRWAVRPNFAAIILEVPTRGRVHVRLRVKRKADAFLWLNSPPTLNLIGLDGLAWLALHGVEGSDEELLRLLRNRNSLFGEIEQTLQNPADLHRQVLLALQVSLA